MKDDKEEKQVEGEKVQKWDESKGDIAREGSVEKGGRGGASGRGSGAIDGPVKRRLIRGGSEGGRRGGASRRGRDGRVGPGKGEGGEGGLKERVRDGREGRAKETIEQERV